MRSFVEGLGNDANILDAGLAHRVYNDGECAERNRFVATEVDSVSLRIVHLGVDLQGVVTKANLADALAVALKRTGHTISR